MFLFKSSHKRKKRLDKTSPLKICLLSYRSNPHCGGQGVYIRNLSRNLKDLGHDVDVVSGPPNPFLDRDIQNFRLPSLDLYNPDSLFRVPSLNELSYPVNFLEWSGVSTMGFPEPLTFGIRAYEFLRNKLNQYDIIHDNQCLSYGVWAINRRTPTIATIHHPITIDRKIDISSASPFWEKMKQMRWYSFINMQKRVSRTFSHIITVSECTKKDISKDFSIPLDRFRIVPNGINIELFYPIPEIEREKNRIIVTNSADMPLKGLYYLLHAISQISKKRDVKLVVIGAPKKDGTILKLIQELGIASLITFTGRIDHIEFVKQYAKATVAVVSSLYEGFGIPAGEAMACGVPVISTTGGALPEVVGDAGILVPTANSSELAKAITGIFDNPGLAKELGEAGYKRVQQHFTWKNAAVKTVEAYREAIVARGW